MRHSLCIYGNMPNGLDHYYLGPLEMGGQGRYLHQILSIDYFAQRERVQRPNYIVCNTCPLRFQQLPPFLLLYYVYLPALFFFELTETVLFPVIHGITYSFNMTSNDFTRKSRSITITCVLQNFKFKNIVGLNLKTKFQHGPGIKNGL